MLEINYLLNIRTDEVKVIGKYQYPDNQDIFEREPYAVEFGRLNGGRQYTLVCESEHILDFLMNWIFTLEQGSAKIVLLGQHKILHKSL